MQTSWGSYGALKDLAHTAFDPPPKLQSVCVTCLLVNTPPLSPRRAAGGWGGSPFASKSAWKCGPVGLNQARASPLLLMYLVFVTSTRGPETSARGSQAGRSVQFIRNRSFSQDRLRRALSAGLSQIYDVFYNP